MGTDRIVKALEAKYDGVIVTAITADNHGTVIFTVDGKEDSITIDKMIADGLIPDDNVEVMGVLVDEWMGQDNPTRTRYYQSYIDLFFGTGYSLSRLRLDGGCYIYHFSDKVEELLSTSFDVENWLAIGTNKADAEAYVPADGKYNSLYSVKES